MSVLAQDEELLVETKRYRPLKLAGDLAHFPTNYTKIRQLVEWD